MRGSEERAIAAVWREEAVARLDTLHRLTEEMGDRRCRWRRRRLWHVGHMSELLRGEEESMSIWAEVVFGFSVLGLCNEVHD